MPFDGSWSYGDALFIVDPWLWLGLGGALFITGSVTVPARLGWAAGCLVTSALILVAPIGIIAKILWVVGIAAAIGVRMLQHRDPAATHEAQRRDRRLHRSTSVLVAAYLLMMVVLNGMAVREVGETLSPTGTQPPQDIMVAPAAAHPFRSDIVALVRGQFVPGTYEWLRSPQVVMNPDGAVEGVRIGDGIRPDQADVAIIEAIQDPDVEDFLAWSRFPLVTVDREEDGFVVRFGDARHLGIGSSSPGGLEVRLTSELRRIDPNG